MHLRIYIHTHAQHAAEEARLRAAESSAMLAKVRASATAQEQQRAALKREMQEVAQARKRTAAEVAQVCFASLICVGKFG
jgi:hypothetical protein